jgi:hypothetical protein
VKHPHLPLDRNLEVREIMKDKLDHSLVLFLADELDERLGWERLSALERGETVLGKAVVKVAEDLGDHAQRRPADNGARTYSARLRETAAP